MLCYRCEKRAEAHETGKGPRYECMQFDMSIHSCYCYEPIKPVILQKEPYDHRPQFGGWMFTARNYFVEVCLDLKLKVESYGKQGKALIWTRRKSK